MYKKLLVLFFIIPQSLVFSDTSFINEIGLTERIVNEAVLNIDKYNSDFDKNFKNESRIKIAKSIIFPEVLRFRSIGNICETYLNIINFDFSIGLFQMKPSFVKMVLNESGLSGVYNDLTNKEFIEKMNNEYFQIEILKYFINLCYDNIEELSDKNDEDTIIILSTAYNLGEYKDLNLIIDMTDVPVWRNTYFNVYEKYPYSYISVYYYNKF
ncbi:MAG: hypothetical protein JEY99_15070 [Spirochaetales bacterium]|nr:hypothetical protein [Spirochaetales bacterium]